MLQKLPAAEAKLGALAGERSGGALHVLKLFKDVRDFARKRLTTTVEEDRSVQEHFEDVKIREEKALSEKSQLQQKLRLDRLQRQRQAGAMARAGGAAAGQLQALAAGHSTAMHGLRASAGAEANSADTAFSACAFLTSSWMCLVADQMVLHERSRCVVQRWLPHVTV
jgi:IQ domain-containing protein D